MLIKHHNILTVGRKLSVKQHVNQYYPKMQVKVSHILHRQMDLHTNERRQSSMKQSNYQREWHR